MLLVNVRLGPRIRGDDRGGVRQKCCGETQKRGTIFSAMKEVLKTDLPITYRNLAWRIFVPLMVLELIGYSLDRTLHLNRFFKISFAIFAITLTVWGLLVTAREAMIENERKSL